VADPIGGGRFEVIWRCQLTRSERSAYAVNAHEVRTPEVVGPGSSASGITGVGTVVPRHNVAAVRLHRLGLTTWGPQPDLALPADARATFLALTLLLADLRDGRHVLAPGEHFHGPRPAAPYYIVPGVGCLCYAEYRRAVRNH